MVSLEPVKVFKCVTALLVAVHITCCCFLVSDFALKATLYFLRDGVIYMFSSLIKFRTFSAVMAVFTSSTCW